MRFAINLVFIVFTTVTSIEASPQVTVRIYNQTTAQSEDVGPALVTAMGILEAAGVAIVWRRCGIGASGADACAAPLSANELAVRLLTQPSATPSAAAAQNYLQLGYSVVDTGAHAGTLATVYPERVTTIARAAGTRADLLLGRAIAHEIGHLLLGTTAHAATGLMQAMWSIDTVRRDLPDDWRFTPRDAVAMQTALK
jgi:hypothetical protein